VTGKPIYRDGSYRPGKIEDSEETLDDIVRRPDHRFVAVIGGDVHNYQRYLVRTKEGRTIVHLVAGGGGAFMHATHKIAKVDLPGVAEEEFHCYPLRGDSLSFYSLLYARKFGYPSYSRAAELFIDPDQAERIVAERLGIEPKRQTAENTAISPGARRAAAFLFPLPAKKNFHRFFSQYFDVNDPPLFKSFLHLEVREKWLRIRCLAATGCLEHEAVAPIEDEILIPLDAGTSGGEPRIVRGR
jgi:hypothetical protein